MKLLFADFETYYAKDYTLRQMTPVEYIMDARFEAHGCAFIEDDGPAYWVDGEHLQAYFDKHFDASDTVLVTHNALFDACICAWRYNFKPKLLVDTLAVSRACLGHILPRHSLAAVSEYLGLGAKGTAIAKTIGLSRAEIRADKKLYSEFVAYGMDDVTKCKGIFDKLVRSGDYPSGELKVMDMVLRCAVSPKFLVDEAALGKHYEEICLKKNQLLASAMLVGANGKGDLMSNDRFAALLVTHGVTPPRKISKLTGNLTYAFAKTDAELIALEEHPDPAVQVLVAARTGHKSTLEESRTERLLSISRLGWPDRKPWLPIPLRNHAAHTHRLGGEWKLNFQNLPRKSPLRSASSGRPLSWGWATSPGGARCRTPSAFKASCSWVPS
jgi:DNA polymerase